MAKGAVTKCAIISSQLLLRGYSGYIRLEDYLTNVFINSI